MAQTLKIRKGDTVQVMKGKDRGKQGRVLEANPKLGRILVENVNMIVRHQRPRPVQNSSRMGGPQLIPRGRLQKAPPVPPPTVPGLSPPSPAGRAWLTPPASVKYTTPFWVTTGNCGPTVHPVAAASPAGSRKLGPSSSVLSVALRSPDTTSRPPSDA